MYPMGSVIQPSNDWCQQLVKKTARKIWPPEILNSCTTGPTTRKKTALLKDKKNVKDYDLTRFKLVQLTFSWT